MECFNDVSLGYSTVQDTVLSHDPLVRTSPCVTIIQTFRTVLWAGCFSTSLTCLRSHKLTAVQLFNAVKVQQKSIESQLKDAGSSEKKRSKGY